MKCSITMSALTSIVLTAHVSNRAPTPRIVPDSEWQTRAPLGFVADTTCCDIAPGGTHEFNQLKITVLATTLDSTGGTRHGVVKMRLAEGGAKREVTVREGTSLNWHGYHVAIAGIQRPGEPKGGLVALRVVPVASLPQCIGKTWKPGTAPWPCT
jgi:hypothetical protein